MLADILVRALVVLLLVGANAFFVAAEFALVSIRETRIQQLIETRRIGARTVQRLHRRLDEVLNAVQFGITLASLALGWVGEPALAHLFERAMGHIPYAVLYSHTLAIIVAFSLITYLHVILGEVVPKSVALQRAERVALAVAAPMDVFMVISRPFLYIMNNSARAVLKLFGTEVAPEGRVHSPEEIKMLVTASRRVGMLPEYQEDMLLRALDLGEITVREIMTPRNRIFALPAGMPLWQASARVVEEQHSRVPAYDEERGAEHVIGLLYSKDISRWMRLRLNAATGNPAAVSRLDRMMVRDIMREVLVVPETKALPDLLLEFRSRKRHLAVVVDEFGSTTGVVTVEDVLEQLVGELEDEFDVALPPLKTVAGAMVLDGAANIRDLENEYDLELPRDEGFETLAGFVLFQLQRIPRPGDAFEYQGRRFTVLEMEGRRVARVRVELLPETARAGG